MSMILENTWGLQTYHNIYGGNINLFKQTITEYEFTATLRVLFVGADLPQLKSYVSRVTKLLSIVEPECIIVREDPHIFGTHEQTESKLTIDEQQIKLFTCMYNCQNYYNLRNPLRTAFIVFFTIDLYCKSSFDNLRNQIDYIRGAYMSHNAKLVIIGIDDAR